MHDPPRILIVDDNATNRDILATRLATQGYALCEAADGEAAITAAKTHIFRTSSCSMSMMPKTQWIRGFAAA